MIDLLGVFQVWPTLRRHIWVKPNELKQWVDSQNDQMLSRLTKPNSAFSKRGNKSYFGHVY